jgi:uncharacterized spore protein YtfJ
MSAKRLIESAREHLRTSAGVKTVYGEPVRVGGKTFIPVAKVAPPGAASGPTAAKPVGVVEISGEHARYLSFGQTRRFAWVAAISATVGLLVGRLFGRRGREG